MPAPSPLYVVRKLHRKNGQWLGSTTGLQEVPDHQAGDWWPRYAADNSFEVNGIWAGAMADAERLGFCR